MVWVLVPERSHKSLCWELHKTLSYTEMSCGPMEHDPRLRFLTAGLHSSFQPAPHQEVPTLPMSPCVTEL